VYNGANYLAEAVDSALAQTYNNIEIIVINDGSNDGGETERIAKSYGTKIKYYAKDNGGVASALNLGVEKMTGSYFSWLSHDDKYLPGKIEKQIDFLSTLKGDKRRIVLYSDYELIDPNGKLIERRVQDHKMLENSPIYGLLRGIVNGITMLIPREVFVTHGDFNVALQCTQDYDMWFRIFDDYKFTHQQEILSQTRIHPNQDTNANPAAVSEGNVLWVRMMNELSDDKKRAAEGGSLAKFYLEMVKFMRHTPYRVAERHCKSELDRVAAEEWGETGVAYSRDDVAETLADLKALGHKQASAYYLSAVIRGLKAVSASKQLIELLQNHIVGDIPHAAFTSVQRAYVATVEKKKRKPRIMFSSGHWLTGGMERVMSVIFRQIKDEYEIFLITPVDDRQGMIELPDYVTHLKMSNHMFYESFDTIALTWALALDIDIAVGVMNLFDKQLEFYRISYGTRVKTIASNHELFFYPYHSPELYHLVQLRQDAFEYADAVLWLTNFSAAAYGLMSDHSYLMPNPNAYHIEKVDRVRNENIILCVGRFNDYIKRVDRMIECFALVSKKVEDAKMVLVGKYDMDAPVRPRDGATIRDLLRENRVDERHITFTGELKAVDEYYKQASVLLLTSSNEGFGMVINEAACYGVPTVCNEIPGLEDLVENGKNGYLVAQGDIQGLANAVENLLADSALRRRMGAEAKRSAARFEENEIGRKWKYLFECLLRGERTSKSREAIGRELAYNTEDYRQYAKLITGEMNKMVSEELQRLSDTVKIGEQPKISKLRVKAGRLYSLAKKEGLPKTVAIVKQKLLKKLKRG
jgi:glycosyltransferase involved in cell wall biosynthesis